MITDSLHTLVDRLNTSKVVFWLACVFLVLPIWLVEYPPMVDLPGHASQVQLMHDLRDDNFLYAGLFQRFYLTPYWAELTLAYLLSFIFGVLGSLKIIITLALISIPYFTRKIIIYFNGNPAWVWLCFPIAYSNPFYWGFLNFVLTVAIGLGWVYFCVKTGDKATINWKHQTLIALGIVAMLFGHLIACGMLGLIVASYYIFINRPLKERVMLIMPLLIFFPLVGAWFWYVTSFDVPGARSGISFEYIPERYKQMLSLLVGRKTWWADIAGLAVLFLPFLAGGVFSHKLGRLLPFLVVLAFVLLLPGHAFGTYLLHDRFSVFVIPLLLFSLEYHPEKTTVLRNMLPFVIAALILSINASDMLAFGEEQKNFQKVIERADPDSRMRKLVILTESAAGDYTFPVYLHFPSWYHLRGHGLVEFNFAGFGRMPVSYKDSLLKQPRLSPRLSQGFGWGRNRGECYDYFISRANVDPFFANKNLQKFYQKKIERVASSGHWYLHKNKHPVQCLETE